jgi:hypothetical protein
MMQSFIRSEDQFVRPTTRSKLLSVVRLPVGDVKHEAAKHGQLVAGKLLVVAGVDDRQLRLLVLLLSGAPPATRPIPPARRRRVPAASAVL